MIVLVTILLMRCLRRYRLQGVGALRAEFRRLTGERRPLLVCANHLTRIDSVLIQWALGGWLWYAFRFETLAWNIAELRNFVRSPWKRGLLFVMKVLPILRGGSREQVNGVLDSFTWLLRTGEVGMIFPEGGRSRSGRFEADQVTYGVGRILTAVPGCRVLCVYLRGAAQETYSDAPSPGDTFRVEYEVLEPETAAVGLRAARDLSRQVARSLASLEHRFLATA